MSKHPEYFKVAKVEAELLDSLSRSYSDAFIRLLRVFFLRDKNISIMRSCYENLDILHESVVRAKYRVQELIKSNEQEDV